MVSCFVLQLLFFTDDICSMHTDISTADDSDHARQLFDTIFEEKINPLNSLDVLRRLVRELCVVGFRSRPMGAEVAYVQQQKQHQHQYQYQYQQQQQQDQRIPTSTPFGAEGYENLIGEQDKGDFPGNDRSFVSMQDGLSPSPNPMRQSTLGTVRMPTIIDYEEDDNHSFDDDKIFNGSGSDVPSEDTSDDGSDEADLAVDVSDGWRSQLKVIGKKIDHPSHLDLFKTLADGAVSTDFNDNVEEGKRNEIRMPVKNVVPTSNSTKSTPNGGVKYSPSAGRTTRMSNKGASVLKPGDKNYLFGLFDSLPAEFFNVSRRSSSGEPMNVFTEEACDFISSAITNYMGLTSDPYVEAEVIRPTLVMFIGSTLDEQAIVIMEGMISSSLKAYEASLYSSTIPTDTMDLNKVHGVS